MKMTSCLTSLILIAGLGACDQIRTPGSQQSEALDVAAPPMPEAVVDTDTDAAPAETEDQNLIQTASIDWAAAREDFASQSGGNEDLVAVASAGTVPVPVLLPEIDFTIASDGPPPLNFTQTPDGYVAVVKEDVYDIIINGTDRLVAAPNRAALPPPEDLRFEETMIGSQVAFSRYGASYLVEFACKEAAPSESCVTEEEAIAAVEDLLLAGTQ